MSLSPGTRLGAAAGYLGMWMAMMVPMMSPSLIPMLARYRRTLGGTTGVYRQGLTGLVVLGYFAIWAVLGGVAFFVGAGLGLIEARWPVAVQGRPLAVGGVLLLAGVVQLSAWKARQLEHCRGGSACGLPSGSDAIGAWRHGLRLGLRCSLCCGSLMLALLAIGMMNLPAMAGVTVAISAERLAPEPLRVARIAGAMILVAGLLTIVRS